MAKHIEIVDERVYTECIDLEACSPEQIACRLYRHDTRNNDFLAKSSIYEEPFADARIKVDVYFANISKLRYTDEMANRVDDYLAFIEKVKKGWNYTRRDVKNYIDIDTCYYNCKSFCNIEVPKRLVKPFLYENDGIIIDSVDIQIGFYYAIADDYLFSYDVEDAEAYAKTMMHILKKQYGEALKNIK